MILIADDIHPVFVKWVGQLNMPIIDAAHWPALQIMEQINQIKILVIRSKFKIDEAFLEKANKLRIIARAGAGLDNIDLAATQRHNIFCLHASEGNCHAVAEHVLGMLLGLINNFPQGHQQIGMSQWQRETNRGLALKELQIGLWGFGHNGRATGQKLMALGANVMAYDKYKNIEDVIPGVQAASPEMLFENADVLSLHIPLTSETNKLINNEFIWKFQKPLFFINAARGELVVWDDLIRAFKQKKIKGMALDVLPIENPGLWPQSMKTDIAMLCNSQRAILTPHVAGWTVDSYYQIAYILAEKLIRLVQSNEILL